MNVVDLKFDRFEEVMHNWARFQRNGGAKLDLPGRSTGLSTGGASQSSNEMCEPHDFRDVLAADALIVSMYERKEMAHYCAIQHAYNIAVYHIRDYDKVLAEAKAILKAGLKRRGVYLG